MIEAYLDESGIHDKAKICIIAGYFGGPSQLKRLESAWKKTLEEFSFPMKDFHAKDLMKNPKHLPMLNALADEVGKQKKVDPVSQGIVVNDFLSLVLEERKFLTGAVIDAHSGKLVTSGCPSKPYFVPFQNIIKVVTDAAPRGGKAHFSFGIDREFSEYAVALWRQILEISPKSKPNSTWKSRERLGEPMSPKATETAQLQAADLLVHACYLQTISLDPANPPAHVVRILKGCLGNSRSRSDHVFQDKECLEKTLEHAHRAAPRWKNKGQPNAV
jgi:hypothetical protein